MSHGRAMVLGWRATASIGVRPARRSSTPLVTAVAQTDRPLSGTQKAVVPEGLNKYSAQITQPKSQGASQAMLHATGLSDEDLNKPQVGEQAFSGRSELIITLS